MIKQFITVLLLAAASSYTLTSCTTPAGRGAAAGAVVGGPVGAAVGAAGGAIVGAAVGETEVARYGPAPVKGCQVALSTGTRGMVASPYSGRVYDVRRVPRGGQVYPAFGRVQGSEPRRN